MTSTQTITLSNHPSELPRMAEYVDELASIEGWSPKTLFHINLALEEIIQNIMTHGYGDGHGVIHVTITVNNKSVRLKVIDEATAFNPLQDATKPNIDTPAHSRPIGGLGVHLVLNVMDAVTYERQNNQNCLQMTILDESSKGTLQT